MVAQLVRMERRLGSKFRILRTNNPCYVSVKVPLEVAVYDR
jgi:hypothetical protein